MSERDDNNIFVKGKLLEPRAKINPEIYEYVALYAALYQSIFGSYADYGFTDRAAVDVYIDIKIKTMMQVIDDILSAPQNQYLTYEDICNNNFVYPTDTTYTDMPPATDHYASKALALKHIKSNRWIANYLPLITEKRAKMVLNPATGAYEPEMTIDSKGRPVEKKANYIQNTNYVRQFLSKFDRTLGIASDLAGRVEDKYKAGGMLTVPAVQQLLKGEQDQLSALFEGYRSASEGQPFKWDPKEKKYKSGAFYEAFRGAGTDSAVNKLKSKNFFIRRGWRNLILKGLGFAASAALTIASGGLMLSLGGVAVSTIFGSAFAGLGMGSFLAGAAGTIVGGTIAGHFGGAFVKELGSLYKKYKDRREFMEGVGKYEATKDGPKGYKPLEKQYLTAVGLKDFFNFMKHADVQKILHADADKQLELRKNKALAMIKDKKARKFAREYLDENPSLVKNAKFYDVIDNPSGTFQTLYSKLANVVQGVPEQTEGRRLFAGEATSLVRDVIDKNEIDFKN